MKDILLNNGFFILLVVVIGLVAIFENREFMVKNNFKLKAMGEVLKRNLEVLLRQGLSKILTYLIVSVVLSLLLFDEVFRKDIFTIIFVAAFVTPEIEAKIKSLLKV